MSYFCPLMDRYSIDKNLTVLKGLDEDISLLIEQCAMPFHDTQSIKLYIIFFDLIRAYLYLP